MEKEKQKKDEITLERLLEYIKRIPPINKYSEEEYIRLCKKLQL